MINIFKILDELYVYSCNSLKFGLVNGVGNGAFHVQLNNGGDRFGSNLRAVQSKIDVMT